MQPKKRGRPSKKNMQLALNAQAPDLSIKPATKEWEIKVRRYVWCTVHGAQAYTTEESLNAAKKRYKLEHLSHADFIKAVQKDIDKIATANPRWDMQRVIETIGV